MPTAAQDMPHGGSKYASALRITRSAKCTLTLSAGNLQWDTYFFTYTHNNGRHGVLPERSPDCKCPQPVPPPPPKLASRIEQQAQHLECTKSTSELDASTMVHHMSCDDREIQAEHALFRLLLIL